LTATLLLLTCAATMSAVKVSRVSSDISLSAMMNSWTGAETCTVKAT